MQIFKKENCLFLLHLRMKIVLIELYIILVYEKFYFLFDYAWIKKVVLCDCTFEICFVYERKCGDMMFCNLNF